jgi:hypothetical protein
VIVLLARVRALAFLALLAACAKASDGSDDGPAESNFTAANAVSPCSGLDGPSMQAIQEIAHVAATCGAHPVPAAEPFRPWANKVESEALALLPANHRGRDLFLTPDEAQWVIGKFAYGPIDSSLVGEEVDISVLRECTGEWERLGTAKTTAAHEHESVEGVDDRGGRVFFRIPDEKKLGLGRHRVRMVVAGDGTTAEQFIEVVPRGTPVFVSDVDGTLTERKGGDLQLVCDEESDPASLVDALAGGSAQPNVHAGAPDLYQSIVALGYRVMYLTARPEWLSPHTRRFLAERSRGDGRGDLPEGIVHTTLDELGAKPSAAQIFKRAELAALRAKGLALRIGFGDQQSDVEAYQANDVPYGFYYEKRDTKLRHCSDIGDLTLAPAEGLEPGTWRHLAYTDLMPTFASTATGCSTKAGTASDDKSVARSR